MTEEDIISEEITNEIYIAYGSDTGVLFGIPSNLRSSVKAVVKVVLQNSRIDFKGKEK